MLQTYVRLPYTDPSSVFSSVEAAESMLDNLCDADKRPYWVGRYLNAKSITVGAAIGLVDGVVEEVR